MSGGNSGISRLCSCRHELRALAEATPSERRAIIRGADKKLIHCLCELSHNVLKGNIDISPKQFFRLNRYRRSLRELADQKLSINRKKDLLLSNSQVGGFLPILASIAAPLISGLLGGVFGR